MHFPGREVKCSCLKFYPEVIDIIYKMVPGEGTRLYQQFPSLKIMV